MAALNAQTDTPRDTLIKRPHDGPTEFLTTEWVARGYLKKLSRHGRWQKRWWEVRGPYLMYWANHSDAGFNSDDIETPRKNPDAAIDIRRIVSIEVKGFDLHLVSSSHVFKLRSEKDGDVTLWKEALEGLHTVLSPDTNSSHHSDGEDTDEQPSPSANEEFDQDGNGLEGEGAWISNVDDIREDVAVSINSNASTSVANTKVVGLVPAQVPKDSWRASAMTAGDSDNSTVLTMDTQMNGELNFETVSASDGAQYSNEFISLKTDCWPSDLTLEVVVGDSKKHPAYRVMVKREDNCSPPEEAMAQYRFGDWRSLKEHIESEFNVKAAVPFPRTYRRNSIGVRLSDDQVGIRAAELNSWLQSVVEMKLPRGAAMNLCRFLRIYDPVLNNPDSSD